MGDIYRDPAFPADDQCLLDGFLQLVSFPADMGGVYAAVLMGHLGDLHQLMGACKHRRCVYKARGKAQTAAFHGLPHQTAHLFQLFLIRSSVAKAHDLAADRSLACKKRQVCTVGNAVHIGKVRSIAFTDPLIFFPGDPMGRIKFPVIRSRHRTALACQLRGGPVLQMVVACGLRAEYRTVGMGMGIDESRSHHQPPGVDHRLRPFCNFRSDPGDLPVLHSHIRLETGRSRSIHHGSVFD